MRRLLLFTATLLFAASAWAFSQADVISVADLPSQARATFALIKTGGPFPHAQDGSVFGNREGLLPVQKRGYYREYTVNTPGSRSRGARRIISGRTHEFYYTDDHYRTFRRILE